MDTVAGAGQLSVLEKPASDVPQALEQIKRLRDRLFERCLERKLQAGAQQRFRPERFQALPAMFEDPMRAAAEQNLYKILAGCLFDSSTMLPVDAGTLHEKVSQDKLILSVISTTIPFLCSSCYPRCIHCGHKTEERRPSSITGNQSCRPASLSHPKLSAHTCSCFNITFFAQSNQCSRLTVT